MKSAKSVNRQKLTIGGLVALGLLIAVVGYMAGISSQTAKASSLDAEIASDQQKYDALHQEKNRPSSLHASELFQLSRAMPSEDDMPGILLELSRLAAASKLQLTAITPLPRVAMPDGSSAVPLKVSATGSWLQLAGFLRALRNEVRVHGKQLSIGGRLFVIDNIAVTPGDTGTGIFATINMNAFDYGAPPSPTATAGGAGTSTSTTTTTTTPSSGTQQAAGSGNGA